MITLEVGHCGHVEKDQSSPTNWCTYKMSIGQFVQARILDSNFIFRGILAARLSHGLHTEITAARKVRAADRGKDDKFLRPTRTKIDPTVPASHFGRQAHFVS
jgi:hypothetical protein